jgi:hypothetical protein
MLRASSLSVSRRDTSASEPATPSGIRFVMSVPKLRRVPTAIASPPSAASRIRSERAGVTGR